MEGIVDAPTLMPTSSPVLVAAPTGSFNPEPTDLPTSENHSTGPTTAKPSMKPTSSSYWDLPELDYVGDNLGGMPLGICQGKWGVGRGVLLLLWLRSSLKAVC